MTKELESIWDCSRMMLPEHKQRIIKEERDQKWHECPMLDPQEVELIERALYKSMEEHSAVTLTLFDPFEDNLVRGVVMKLDKEHGIKFRWSEDDGDWYTIENIIGVNV